MYDYAVYIGRFQPFHVGHQSVVQFANQQARKTIMLVGSSNIHRSPKDPWTFEERKMFIEKSLADTGIRKPIILPINDVPYNDTAWITQVRSVVHTAIPEGSKVVLVGFQKDESSYYLDLFKGWDYVPVRAQFGVVNATAIRDVYFQENSVVSGFLAADVRRWLEEFAFTDTFRWLLDEQKFLVDYRAKWGSGPFNTADCVVVQSGRILLVTRKYPPYRGSLALPGGFINITERIIDSAVRELNEETKISDDRGEIPPGVLKSYIRKSALFDNPSRSARGRIITNAFLLQLPEHKRFYVKGDDDAAAASWYPLDSLDPCQFMEDHWSIIQELTGITWK